MIFKLTKPTSNTALILARLIAQSKEMRQSIKTIVPLETASNRTLLALEALTTFEMHIEQEIKVHIKMGLCRYIKHIKK